ncbi:MAG: hypothetical protein N3A62_00705 [Thermodesulfovibrionales bacterium]|nr:hypothetical protein [Thermodesulfovibrionales bacterium]
MDCSAKIITNQTGRIRFRLNNKKADYLDNIGQQLLTFEGVYSVKTNPTTGSILVLHNTNGEEILKQIKNRGFMEINETDKKEISIVDATRISYDHLDNFVKRYLGGLNIHSLVLASLLITGVYQLLRGNIGLPAWYVAFWYAMTLAKR